MRAYFYQDALTDQGMVADSLVQSYPVSRGGEQQNTQDDFVHLAVDMSTLRRLLHQNQIRAEEIRSLGGQAKEVVKGVMLDHLADAIG